MSAVYEKKSRGDIRVYTKGAPDLLL